MKRLESKSSVDAPEDLLSNLFKGYAATSDKTFCAYIQKKKEDYDEGKVIPGLELMVLAENKYKSMVEGQIWRAPDEQAEQIIALQAQVKKLAQGGKTKSQGSKDFKAKSDNDNNNKKKTKQKGSGPQGATGKPDWMLKKPSDGEPKTKMVNGKTYHWCTNHQSWTIHSLSECKGKGFTPSSNDKGKSVAWDGKTKKPNLKVAKALQAIADEDLEDEGSDF